MKSFFQCLASVFFVLFFCLSVQAGSNPLNAVVATVNDVKIIEAELVQEVNRILPMNAGFHGNITQDKMDNFRAEALKNLVELELQFQHGIALGMKLNEEEQKSTRESLLAKFSSKKEYDKALKNAGFDEVLLNRFMERQAVAARVVRALVDDKVLVTEQDLKVHYENNVSRYKKPEEFRAAHILVKVDPASTMEQKNARRTRAEELLKKARTGGVDFAELAARESDDMSRIKGGDIGSFHTGQTMPEFEDTLKKLKPGEVGELVETLYGYHVIKLIDRKPSRQLDFGDVKNKIRDELVKIQRTKLFDEFMSSLHAKFRVVYPVPVKAAR